MEICLLGGAVRDELLGLEVYDRDWVVVGATAEEMLKQGFRPVGKDFPVFLHPDTQEEYALARTERKTGTGYHGFEVFAHPSVSLEEDLLRRDLTINAMAKTPAGELIDPYGGGEDLAQRVLRHVSPAFSEDPLRVLRVARFAARLSPFGFQIAPETHDLMVQMVRGGELNDLTPERVWKEVVKALRTVCPSVFFKVLDAVGAVQVLFPGLFALQGVMQPEKYHPEGDVWSHSLMALDAAARLTEEASVRFAALVHDLGKGETKPELWPKHYGHEAAGVPLVKEWCEYYRVPKVWQQLAEQVTLWHGVIHQGVSAEGRAVLKPGTYLKVLKACGVFKSEHRFQQILLACEADAKGRLGFENQLYFQRDFWLKLGRVSRAVDPQVIIQQGFKGGEISKELERVRLSAIQVFIECWPQKDQPAC